MKTLLRLLNALLAAEDRHRANLAVNRLDDRLLRDIGISPEARPGWDAPPHWRLPDPDFQEIRHPVAETSCRPA